MRDTDGAVRMETYGKRTGVVVNPSHAAVRARHEQTLQEFTTTLPVDFLFEDQVGARDGVHGRLGVRWEYPAALVENTRTAAKRIPLMTEGGWDRLAETEIGFCGNGRLEWEQPKLPKDAWRPYPLMQLMANAHTATYPHNLAGEHMVHNREELLYNVAFGCHLAYDLNRGIDEWMTVCAALQSRVLSRSFGQAIVNFEDNRPTTGSTLLVYANGDEVFANWSKRPLPFRTHLVPPEGFAYTSPDGSLLAGYFTQLDGKPLDGGADRILLIENGKTEVLLGPPLP